MTSVRCTDRGHGDLEGQLAVITGGAGDIGAAVAHELHRRGARVLLGDIDMDRAEKIAAQFDGRVEVSQLDLADDDSIQRFASEVEVAGGCAVLVSNAGRAVVEPFTDSDPAEWDALYRINQRGPILLTHLLLPTMLAAGFGRMVFVSSDGARAGASGEAVYAATKSALFGFAKSVARESARAGVTANVVCPGPVRGRMVEELLADKQHHAERFERSIPMRRFGQPEEVASLIGWLAGPTASYVTGQVVSVSGGITMH